MDPDKDQLGSDQGEPSFERNNSNSKARRNGTGTKLKELGGSDLRPSQLLFQPSPFAVYLSSHVSEQNERNI